MLQHAHNRTGELTDRRRLLVPADDVVRDVDRFLRGWSGYFRYGNSARQFNDINR
jgi:Group II intron, maturase-specific domain